MKIMVFPEPCPHSSIKCTTSPNRNEGCPVKTTHGVLNVLLNPSKNISDGDDHNNNISDKNYNKHLNQNIKKCPEPTSDIFQTGARLV